MNRFARFALLASASLAGGIVIGWPLFVPAAQAAVWQQQAGPVLSALLLPIVIGIVINDFVAADFNPRTTAVIAALIALGVALRMVAPGAAGIEPIWLAVLLAGRALGAAAGFTVGAGAIALSAVATGGVGPWLPYQMIAAAWVGLGAGLLPRIHGRSEPWLLAAYGAVSSFAYGWLLNLWFWPTAVGLQPALEFDASASWAERAANLARFSAATSLAFDLPRAIVTATLVLLTGRRLLAAVRRVAAPAASSGGYGIVSP